MGPRGRWGLQGPTQASEPIARKGGVRLRPAVPVDRGWRPPPLHPEVPQNALLRSSSSRFWGRGPSCIPGAGKTNPSFPGPVGGGGRPKYHPLPPKRVQLGGVRARKVWSQSFGKAIPWGSGGPGYFRGIGQGHRGEGAAWGTRCPEGAPKLMH